MKFPTRSLAAELVLFALVVGCGRTGFELGSDATSSPDTSAPTDVMIDGALPPSYVGKIGDARCGGTQLTITAAAAIPAGNTLVATLVTAQMTIGSTPTIADSAGNA